MNSSLPHFSLSLTNACSCLNISKSGYHDWVNRNISDNQSDSFDIQIRGEIHQIAIDFPRYGYRRMTKELQRRGFRVNSKRVLRLMRKDNLLCIKKIFVPLTTDSNHNHKTYPNLTRGIEVTGINQALRCFVWVP